MKETHVSLAPPMRAGRTLAPGRNVAGFSLTELLVVIAIIAILAMLGVSWTSGAIDKGNVAKCASNLRQLSTAATSFAADHGGRLPWASFNDLNPPDDRRPMLWFSAIAPYIGATVVLKSRLPVVGDGSGPEKIMISPATPKLGLGGITDVNISYGWNFIGLSQNDGANTAAWITGGTVALGAIPEPSKTVMIANTSDRSTSKGLFYVTASSNGNSAAYRPAGPHGGKANAVFCDGHVKLMQLTNTGPATNPTVRGLWDAYWWRLRK